MYKITSTKVQYYTIWFFNVVFTNLQFFNAAVSFSSYLAKSESANRKLNYILLHLHSEFLVTSIMRIIKMVSWSFIRDHCIQHCYTIVCFCLFSIT